VSAAVAIRDAVPVDAPAIAAIYNREVLTGTATFELEAVVDAAMAGRIAAVQARGLPWLVASNADEVLGYAYASPWKPRGAYAHSVETSVYVAGSARGRDLGGALYAELIERAREAGMHALIGGVTLPNAASVRLHEALGFAHIGTLREVGFKFGRWVDVGYWQKLLTDRADASPARGGDGG